MVTEKTDQHKFTVFAIAGFAGAGKDTLADSIARNLPDGMAYCKIKMADALKRSLQLALDDIGVKFNTMTEVRGEKQLIRPLLVEFGRFCRSIDKGVFAERVASMISDINEVADVALVPDMRYINEYSILEEMCDRNNWNFVPIYISCPGVHPANDEEFESIHEMLNQKIDEISEVEIPMGMESAFDEVAMEIVKAIY